MICGFWSYTSNLTFSYFYHECKGLKVPEVKIIERGRNFRIYVNVKDGVRQTKRISYNDLSVEFILIESLK